MKQQIKSLKADVIRWKQFSRKGDAIFRSLGREIVISTLSVATLSFAIPENAYSQTVTNPPVEEVDDTLQTVEVTAALLPLPMNKSARIVGVITHEEIENCVVNSVNDVLKFIASIDVRQRGAFGIQTDVSINGGTHDQIVILIDGVNVSSPHTGHLATDFPLTTDDIERIEILEGAASRIYGTSAFSGAINIITKKNTVSNNSNKWNGTIGLETGSFGTMGGSSSIVHTGKGLFNRLSLSYKRSDGGTTNSDFNKTSIFYNGGLKSNLYDVNWHLGANLQGYGANTFYSGKFNNQYEYNQKYLGALSFQTKGSLVFKPTIYWSKAFDHYQLVKHSEYGENYHMTDVYGLSFNMSHAWMLGTTLVSADFRNEGILSSSLGKPLDESDYVGVPYSKAKYKKKDNRTNISYFIEHDLVLDKWSFSFGVMANMNTSIDHKFRLYPGIDICYKPSRYWKFYTSWNMAQRMPTFTDLYYKSPTQEGNKGLKPEETNEFSLATNYRSRGIKASIRLFYRHDKSMIDWILTPDDEANGYTTYHAVNFKLDKYGGHINTEFFFDEIFDNITYLKSLNVGYSYISQKRFDDIEVYASSYALDYLRHKLMVNLNANITSNLSVDFSFRFQNRKGGFVKYVPFINDDGKQDYITSFNKYRSYGIFSMKLKWKIEKYELYAQADNLTNKKYYDIGNVQQPGLWFMCGAKYNW